LPDEKEIIKTNSKNEQSCKQQKMGNEIWEEKGWTNEDMKRMAKEHMPL